MLRRLFTTFAAVLLSGGSLIPAFCADDTNNPSTTTAATPVGQSVQTEGSNPFTHLARIPVGADLRTIRFEKVKMVQVPASVVYTMDSDYCSQLAFRDPGGSIACPQAHAGALVAAYEATYSFSGQPLASDEYGTRDFTFTVYFRPDELTPEAQKSLAARKMGRTDAAGYFTVSTYRETVSRVAIDGKQSRLCEGGYVDGAWTRSNPRCEDKVIYSSVSEPSGYITVKIDPVLQAGTPSSK